MFSVIKYPFVYLCRITNVRGFGIQSPSAFYFANEVINQRLPYYKYKELASATGECNFIERKLLKLYLRVANYVRPSNIVIIHSDYADDGRLTNAAKQYLHGGCETASMANWTNAETIGMLFALLDDKSGKDVIQAMEKLSEGGCCIVQGINESTEARQWWQKIKSHDKATVVFDLYYAGIVVYNEKHTKGSYKVNF